MELSRPFVRLPFSFDDQRLAEEVAQLDDTAWMPHPGKLQGNSAIPLISLGGGNNNNFSGPMELTPYAKQCDYILQVMATFDEVLARSRLMRLDSGCEVPKHVDFNYHWYDRVRIHIPVITNSDVTFYCGDELINMKSGECWIFDSWRNHRVINAAGEDRIHLVIDTAGSSRFWKQVSEMEQYGIDRAALDASGRIRFVEYEPGRTVSIQCERYNVAPVMAPGELEALATEIIADCRQNSDNDPGMLDEYESLLTDLAKDWRESWLLYGFDSAGEDHYRGVLEAAASRMHRNPRVLVTKSNDIGVNPIIVQRILRAALNLSNPAAHD